MADANHATCPQCGAPFSDGDAAGLCPRCRPADAPARQSEEHPVSPSSRTGARRTLTLVLAVAALGAALLGGLWFVCTRMEQGTSMYHERLGIALVEQGKLEEAVAEFRTAIRLEPDDAWPHYNLGCALKAQGKRDEAVAEWWEAIRLHPPIAYSLLNENLGNAPGDRVKKEEPIAPPPEAIQPKGDNAAAD